MCPTIDSQLAMLCVGTETSVGPAESHPRDFSPTYLSIGNFTFMYAYTYIYVHVCNLGCTLQPSSRVCCFCASRLQTYMRLHICIYACIYICTCVSPCVPHSLNDWYTGFSCRRRSGRKSALCLSTSFWCFVSMRGRVCGIFFRQFGMPFLGQVDGREAPRHCRGASAVSSSLRHTPVFSCPCCRLFRMGCMYSRARVSVYFGAVKVCFSRMHVCRLPSTSWLAWFFLGDPVT